jgi:phenylacetate-CoA ligase
LYNKFKPRSIDGYSQSIFTIADYIGQNGIRVDRCGNILGTAENLFPHQKDTIEKHLGPFNDLYGFGEINGIALKPAGRGKYIVLDSRVFLEGIPRKQPGTHEIIVTDLFNSAFPFIRYKPGDLFSGIDGRDAIHSRFSTFSNLEGRTANIIELPNGLKVHPVNLLGGTFFRKHLELRKHRVTWDGNELHLIFEVKGDHSVDGIRESMEEYLKPYGIPFRISFTARLESGSSGKYNYFENLELNKSPTGD